MYYEKTITQEEIDKYKLGDILQQIAEKDLSLQDLTDYKHSTLFINYLNMISEDILKEQSFSLTYEEEAESVFFTTDGDMEVNIEIYWDCNRDHDLPPDYIVNDSREMVIDGSMIDLMVNKQDDTYWFSIDNVI